MIARLALLAALSMGAAASSTPAHAAPPLAPPSRTRVVRPPDDPGRRGWVVVPAWAVWATTAAAVALAVGVLWREARRGGTQ